MLMAVVDYAEDDLGGVLHLGGLMSLVSAITELATGAQPDLLRPAKVSNRPEKSVGRRVEEVAGVLAAVILQGGGLTATQANREAAQIMTREGVRGSRSDGIASSTIAKWRIAAERTGTNPEYGEITDAWVSDLRLPLSPDQARKLAIERVRAALASPMRM
jgi:hypothetical protein